MKKILKGFVQKKNNLLIYHFVYLTLLYFPAGAQTLIVQGKVTSSRLPIKQASVTFIDNADTTKIFSKVVIVAVNSGSTQTENVFRIENGTMTTTFTPYTTSEFKNCEQGNVFDVTGDNFIFTLEPSSIITFVSN